MALSEGAGSLDRLVTEARRADADYDSRSTQELVELMNEEDASVLAAVAAVGDALAAAIEGIVARLGAGGRLVYVGAGSSGRIAQLDAEHHACVETVNQLRQRRVGAEDMPEVDQ